MKRVFGYALIKIPGKHETEKAPESPVVSLFLTNAAVENMGSTRGAKAITELRP